ncbi:MAG: hypothetical protein WAT19_07490 [Ferruginibacter sp.]
MKPFLLLQFIFTWACAAHAQSFAAIDIAEASGLSPAKLQAYLIKKGFVGGAYSNPSEKQFRYKGIKGKAMADSASREISMGTADTAFYFSYNTGSAAESGDLKTNLKAKGFSGETDFFQKNNITVKVSATVKDTITTWSFFVKRQLLPPVHDIIFAEDLLAFNSHEMLRFYFGDKNLKKDLYYFSDNEVNKCSVLFPNSNRQVVFIWDDEKNNYQLGRIYIGALLSFGSASENQRNTGENMWQLKNGIKTGMSLYQLRMLNGSDFNFGGGRSAYTGLVFSDGKGKFDFNKENIILGCVNCNDPYFEKAELINSDDALQEQRIIFVQTIVLNAQTALHQNGITKNMP